MKTLGHRRQPQEASLWPNNISWWYLNEKLQELLSSSQLLLEPSIGQYCKHNIVAGCITCNLLYVYFNAILCTVSTDGDFHDFVTQRCKEWMCGFHDILFPSPQSWFTWMFHLRWAASSSVQCTLYGCWEVRLISRSSSLRFDLLWVLMCQNWII